MRFHTSGELRRIDVSPVVGLLPALGEEWANLQFDDDGSLLNSLTGERITSVSILDGRHRQVGARYRLSLTRPKLDLPEDRRAEFDKESRRLSQRNAKQDAWSEYHARRLDASVQVGTHEQLLMAMLREDNGQSLAFTLTDEDEHWNVEIDIEHSRLPRAVMRGNLDLTALLKADGTPGCLAGLFGGPGDGTATLDFAALERDGRIVDAQGHANRFRGIIDLDVRTSRTRWVVRGNGVLRARGLARPILWFFGRRMRRSIDQTLTEFWTESESRTRDLDRELHHLRSAIAEEGGQVPFVRRVLWDDDFDPDLESLRRTST